MSNVRVLHVIPSLALQTGGPAVMVVELAAALSSRSVFPRIITTDALTSARSRTRGSDAAAADFPAEARSLDIEIYSRRPPYRFCFSPELFRALRRQAGSFDLLHIHSINLFPQMAAWWAANERRVPYIVTPHGALDPWVLGKRRRLKQVNDLIWQRRMLDGAAAIHLTTEDERSLVQRLDLRSPLYVVPNGINVSRFSAVGDGDAFRTRWLQGYSGPVILNHGRLSEKKGLDVLVSSLPGLKKTQDVKVVLVGADDEDVGAALRRLAQALGVADSLSIVPKLSGVDLIDAITAADVWALPSHSENFGLAVAEAMAAGKPVVTSPHVNIAPEAVAENALVMVPNTVERTTSAIEELLSNRERRQRVGMNAARFVQKYDWPAVAGRFEELYRIVIEESNR